ncbi:MAG: RimK family alpha-L-glutamate ligase [Pseudomonadales bacterium]
MRFVFVTYEGQASYSKNDALVADWLIGEGHEVTAIPWTEPVSSLNDYDLIVMRSAWDYPRRAAEFARWLDAVAELPVANTASLMRWNSNKRYLLDLAQQSVNIPRTKILKPGDNLDQLMSEWDVDTAVVKPTVGASGQGVVKVQRGDQLPDAQETNVQWLIQEFMPEIAAGEASLCFFGGKFSHAILKQPQAGEFRINQAFGGRNLPLTPATEMVQAAQAVLESLDHVPLYARVDGLMQDSTFVLFELELVEPSFYFLVAPEAAQHFGRAIVDHALALLE